MSFLQRFEKWFLEPTSAISGSTARERARLLALVMLLFNALNLPLYAAIYLLVLLNENFSWHGVSFYGWPVICLAGVLAYILSRTKFYQIGALIVTLTLGLGTIAAMFGSDMGTDVAAGLLLPVIIVSIWFSVRGAAIMAVTTMVLIILSLIVGPITSLVSPVTTLIACGLLLVFVGYRNRVERALRESENRAQAIVDNAPFGAHFYELRPNGRLVFVGASAAADRILGIDHAQFAGKTLEEAFPQLTQTEIPAAYRQAAALGKPYFSEQVDYDEQEIRGAFEVNAFQTGTNRMAVFFRDITKRKQAETREQLAYELGQRLITQLDPDAIMAETVTRLIDTFGYYHVHIYLLSEDKTELFVREGTGEAGAEMKRSGHTIPLEARRSLVARAARLLEPVVVNNVVESSDHLPNPLLPNTHSEAALPLYVGQELVGVLDAQHDRVGHFDAEEVRTLQIVASQLSATLSTARLVREIRALNIELEQRVRDRTRELEATNQELEAFAYSVSHDLRAPLRAIDGFSQALLEDYHDDIAEEGQDFLQRVRAASQRMAQLIDDLLQLSRITRSDMQYEQVDLSALTKAIAAELQDAHPDRHVDFLTAPGLVARGDERLLRIALANLLENAWKFTEKQRVARIEFGHTEIDGQAAYFVRDNGVGFDMAYADRLFGAFQRLHSAEEFAGTGIGLATVQRIIHRHGGRVWAEGEEGQGAAFYFTL